MENVHVFNIGIISIHGEEFLRHSIKNTEDLTMKQTFDISAKLVSEQSDEIYGMNTIYWEHTSWKYLSLVRDEQVVSLLHTKDYVFSDSVLCLGKVNENPKSNIAWEDRRIIFMSMFNDISWRSKDNKIECESNAYLVSLFTRRFGAGPMVILRTWIREKVVFYQ